MAVHTLPTFLNHLGTFTVTVTTDATVTTPTIQTIVGLRSGENSIELIPGTLQPAVFTVSVCDDTAGFWKDVIDASTSVLITLDEGSGTTLVFNGDISQRDSVISEVYNDGTTKVRRIEVMLYSILERLRYTSIDDMVTLVLANDVALSGGPAGHGMTLNALFACAIEAATDQAYNATDGYYLHGGGDDWEFTNAADADFDFDQVYVRTSEDDDSPDEYWDSADPLYLGKAFDNCYDLVVAMAKNFYFVPTYDYDIANSRHRIKLLQASNNYAANIDLGAPESSSYTTGQQNVLASAFVDMLSSNGSAWLFQNTDFYRMAGFFDGMTQEDLPAWISPQLNVETLFTVYEVGNTSTETLFTSAGDPITSITVKGANIFSGAGIFQKGLLSYIVRRHECARVTYHRTYPILRPSGGSHTAVDLMATVTIDGGYYAITAVDKDFGTGKLTLTLVKI